MKSYLQRSQWAGALKAPTPDRDGGPGPREGKSQLHSSSECTRTVVCERASHPALTATCTRSAKGREKEGEWDTHRYRREKSPLRETGGRIGGHTRVSFAIAWVRPISWATSNRNCFGSTGLTASVQPKLFWSNRSRGLRSTEIGLDQPLSRLPFNRNRFGSTDLTASVQPKSLLNPLRLILIRSTAGTSPPSYPVGEM